MSLASSPSFKNIASPRYNFLCLSCLHCTVPELGQAAEIGGFLGMSCINDFVITEDINESDISVTDFLV